LGVLANLRVSTKVVLVGAVAVGVGLLLAGLRVKQDLEVLQQVTERMALADLEKVLPAVDALRARGFQLALDDFGTGVSSLYLLRRLPVDYVKVDRSFVRNLAVDVHDQAIIRSVVELCRGLGRFVVAEGVETEEVLERLRGLGVDYAQGYHIARPAPLEEVLGRR
jgi:EAL domain-containing protein (putative c-di-GMP-specific phosphodiesterase class I)